MNALIAPNGYGKSNVLRAIDFGIKFLTATEQERGTGYAIREMVKALDFAKIRSKRLAVLRELEEVLGLKV